MPFSVSLSDSDPIAAVYKFMTVPSIHNPEVTIVDGADMQFYDSSTLPSEEKFRRECKNAVIIAVASFDSADLRRINLSVLTVGVLLSVYDKKDEKDRDALCRKLM